MAKHYNDFLAQICVAKQSYTSLEILSDEFENKKILNKLPAWLVNNWIEKVVDHGSLPNFDVFSQFIKDKVTIANHALWAGHSALTHTSAKRSVVQVRPACTRSNMWLRQEHQVQGSQTE